MAWVSLQTIITVLATSGTTAILAYAISPFYNSMRAYFWSLFRYQPLYDALEQLREVNDQVEREAAATRERHAWLQKAAELMEKGKLLIRHKIRSAKSWRRLSSSNHTDEENHNAPDIEAPPVVQALALPFPGGSSNYSSPEQVTISFEQPLPQQMISGSSDNQNDGQDEICPVRSLPKGSSNSTQNADQNEDQLFEQNFGNGCLRFSFLRKVNKTIAYEKLLYAVYRRPE